jgi:glycosyltransferase involved in cell wall biosynthesis
MAARAAGYDVIVVTRVREHGDVICAAGLKLIPFEVLRSSTNVFRDLQILVRLVMLYRRERPNVVHHVAVKPVLYGSVAALLAGIPGVINALAGMGWLRSSGVRRGRWLRPIVGWGLGSLLRRGVALVQNPDDAHLLAQLGVPKSRIRRIAGSGVDLRLFTARPEPDGIPIVVLPARLLWDKGIGEFVAAARLLRQRSVVARFVLAGEPDEASPSSVPRDQIAKWVNEGVVEHRGWVKDVPKLLGESHIVCLPSFYGEGIPKSLIEAAAAGKPIVTCDTPGCREIVHGGDNGLLVPPRDPEALAEALALLIGDGALRQRMGARGRARAEQEFGLETVIQQTLALYDEVVV